MPTSADLMSMWNASGLKSKIIFTVLMIAAFRFGVQLPVFGINNAIFSNIASGNNLIGFLDLFSGGALGKVSIFALGIGPFITASIIIQLMAVVVPSLEKLQKEDLCVVEGVLEAGLSWGRSQRQRVQSGGRMKPVLGALAGKLRGDGCPCHLKHGVRRTGYLKPAGQA